jgi:hypothetical protein
MGWQRPMKGPFARAARLAGLAVVTVTLTLAAAFLLLPLAIRVFVRGLELAVNGCIWLAASLSAGADAWTILKAVGLAAGSALVSPRVFATFGALVLVGALALYGLQRLFDSEEESSR